jgi:hypothetical protein
MITYEAIIDALERGNFGPGKRSGKETSYRCPVHDDHSPSLDVAKGSDGKALLICRSRGCSFESIVRALDIPPTTRNANGNGNQKIVAEYDYLDENGVRLYQVVRYHPKDFLLRHRGGLGGWTWNLDGVRRVPYRLPELLAAGDEEMIFICEGEKNADDLAQHGLTATTNPNGAGKWGKLDKETVRKAFRGRNVIVLPDNDDPGRKHADDVARDLKGIAQSVKIVNLPGLPDKGDVSDWLGKGWTTGELTRLADQAPEFVPSAPPSDSTQSSRSANSHSNNEQAERVRTSGAWTPAPIDSATFARGDYSHDWLVKALLVTREPAIIFGPSKVLKTSIVIDAAISLATGTPVLGRFDVPHARRVLVISGESGPASLQSIARRVCAAKSIDLASIGEMVEWEFSLPPLSDLEARTKLGDLLAGHRREVVVIDPTYLALLAGGTATAEKAANLFHMGPLLGALVDECNRAGSQLLLIHHCNTRIAIGDEPELSHLAFAGFQQFARQWIGLNRRVAFSHDGKHELLIVAGGSAGHGGKWVCKVDEGELADDFSGRKWEVVVEPFAGAKAREMEEKAAAKLDKREKKIADEVETVYTAIRDGAVNLPITCREIRDRTRLNNSQVNDCIRRLMEAKRIESLYVERPRGKGKQMVTGYQLPRGEKTLLDA